MFGLLPDLTPRDSHSIWYTSSRRPVTQVALLDGNEQRNNPDSPQQQHGSSSRRAAQLLIERSALARLRADEQLMDRRKMHIQNFGSGWLKPPAVPKTLHQMREEEKEQKEHAEAMRREQLAQELADAEAAGQDVLEDGGTGDLGADLDAEEEEEVHDLDDEIPDADDSFGFDGGDDSAAEEGLSGMTSSVVDPSSDNDDDEDRDSTPGPGYGQPGGGGGGSEHGDSRREELVEERMRMADDAYRQAMARGQADGEDIYGGDEDLEAEGGGHMLDEEDLVPHGEDDEDDMGMGMDMDADLDDDIPEAGELSGLADLSGVYEHTDSEVDLSSSIAREPSSDEDEEDEDEDEDISFAGPRAAPLMAPPSPTGRRGGGGPRSSMDLSGLLSGDSSMMDSSMMHSSPGVRAQRR
ncbi:hypothetical protein CkaCkLH20_04068 [Colletotrichum karsti]|uniref:Replicase polyprotein 1a n=1 Tax=Colletotrichum karsti TaxID=1095194 RepID=A0A9P6IB69_9PEZI|nr:uncharacterized protein CkaCkLH20_04068 [Colletotrichum karsti]KAF9878576.1 hypothetical protein CkaCkLH20_04068 [Colletotrichum karsti]